MPVRGSLLHGYVTAISKSEPRIGQKPSSNRYNGTYGLQVRKVAQLVEQVSIPSPRFDSWLSIDGSNISHLIGMDQEPAGDDLVNSNTFFETPCRNMGCFR